MNQMAGHLMHTHPFFLDFSSALLLPRLALARLFALPVFRLQFSRSARALALMRQLLFLPCFPPRFPAGSTPLGRPLRGRGREVGASRFPLVKVYHIVQGYSVLRVVGVEALLVEVRGR